MYTPLLRIIFVAVSVLYLVLGISIFPAYANTFIVNDLGDDPETNTGDNFCNIDGTNGHGRCTLRAAIMQANDGASSPGIDHITVTVSGTINILTSLPTIVSEININGGGVTVDNIGTGEVFRVLYDGDENLGSLTLANMTITGGSATNGGGIVTQGSLTLNSGTHITGNSASANGGGIFVYGGATLQMNGATVSENNARDGGGVFLQTNSVLNFTSGLITENTATRDGGGVYLLSGADLNMITGTIADNTATQNGGGIYASSSSTLVTIFGGSIVRNEATVEGGGVYFLSGADLNMNGGSIDNNHAPIGAGIYATGSNTIINITGGLIRGNIATGNGGGIYARSSASINMTGGRIESNRALSGGGVYLGYSSTGAQLTAQEAIFVSNEATSGNGSAIFQDRGSTTVSNSAIICNRDNAIQYSGGSGSIRMNMGGNWWGSDYGPYHATNGDGLQCGISISDSLNSSVASTSYGITVTAQSVCPAPAIGNWLTSPISGSPTIDHASSNGRARYCFG